MITRGCSPKNDGSTSAAQTSSTGADRFISTRYSRIGESATTREYTRLPSASFSSRHSSAMAGTTATITSHATARGRTTSTSKPSIIDRPPGFVQHLYWAA